MVFGRVPPCAGKEDGLPGPSVNTTTTTNLPMLSRVLGRSLDVYGYINILYSIYVRKKNGLFRIFEKSDLEVGQAGPWVTTASTPNLPMLSRVLGHFLDVYGYINILYSIYVSKKNGLFRIFEKSDLEVGQAGPWVTTASTPNLPMLSRVLGHSLDVYGYINILYTIYVRKKNGLFRIFEKSDLAVGQAGPLVTTPSTPNLPMLSRVLGHSLDVYGYINILYSIYASKKNGLFRIFEKSDLEAGQAGPLVTTASTPNLPMLSRVLGHSLDVYGYINILYSIYVSKKNGLFRIFEKSDLAAGQAGPWVTTASTPNLPMLSRVLGHSLDVYGYINILYSIYVSKKNGLFRIFEKSDLAAGQAGPLVTTASTPNLPMLSRVLGHSLDVYGYINILYSIYASKKNGLFRIFEKSDLEAGQAGPLVTTPSTPNLPMLSRVLGHSLDVYGYINILYTIYASKKNGLFRIFEKSDLAAGQAGPLVTTASTPNLPMLSRVLGHSLDVYGYINILYTIYASKKNGLFRIFEKSDLAAGQAGPWVTTASTPNLPMLSRVLGRFLDVYGYINILYSIYASKKNGLFRIFEKSDLAAGQAGPWVTTASTPNLPILSRVLGHFLDVYGYINILYSIYVSKKNGLFRIFEKSDLAAGQAGHWVTTASTPNLPILSRVLGRSFDVYGYINILYTIYASKKNGLFHIFEKSDLKVLTVPCHVSIF